jgi:phosphoglycerate dehydrogenase-like enzyme
MNDSREQPTLAASSTSEPISNPVALITEELDPQPAAWLAERCEVVRCAHDDPALADELLRAHALIVRTYTLVNAGLLAQAPRLRVVARAGVGLDNIDLEACRKKGVRVVSTPGANTRAVVEYVLAMLLDATRPRLFLDRVLPMAEWKKLRGELEAPRQLADMTLGIVGLGRIGRQVARVAASLEMRVIYHDLIEIPIDERFGAEPVSREELLASSDAITVHVDGRSGNRGLIDADWFGRMRSDVVLINTSRGMVVQPEACAAFLRAHSGATALLDVHEPEPLETGSVLLGVPNAHLSPHIAGGTRAAKLGMSWVVRDVWRVLNGEQAEHAAV